MTEVSERPAERRVRVAAIQQPVGEQVAANIESTIAQVSAAAQRGAQLIVTQELFASRYFCQTESYEWFETATAVPGPLTDQFAQVARETKAVLVLSLFEKRAAGLFHNTAVVIDADGSIAGRYRKMHIPDDPLYYEKFYFTPGDAGEQPTAGTRQQEHGVHFRDGFHAVDTAVGRIGVIICWDQWYPESARLTALDGAEILCVPTAIGHHPIEKATAGPAQLDAWETVQRSHAIANGVFIVVANRTGYEPTPDKSGEGIDFWGHSFVAGPDGVVIASAPRDEPTTLVADLDLAAIDVQRQNWPFFRDRRVDAYGGIVSRWSS